MPHDFDYKTASPEWMEAARKAVFIVDPGAVNPGPVADALSRAVIAVVIENRNRGLGNRFRRGDPAMAPARLILSQLTVLVGGDENFTHDSMELFGLDLQLCRDAKAWSESVSRETEGVNR